MSKQSTLETLEIAKETAKVIFFLTGIFSFGGLSVASLQYTYHLIPKPTVEQLQAKCDSKYKACSAYATSGSVEPQ